MKRRLMLLVVALSGAPALGGQEPVAAPEVVTLRTCAAQADSGKANEAETTGTTAASLYRKRIEKNPRDVEGLVGLGRALSQCLVPAAGSCGRASSPATRWSCSTRRSRSSRTTGWRATWSPPCPRLPKQQHTSDETG